VNFKLILGATIALSLGAGALFSYVFPKIRLSGHPPSTSTPLTRVGSALGASQDPRTWAYTDLKEDVQAARKTFSPQHQALFDLVVAARGLENRGTPEWARAERYCHALGFPRCDKDALVSLSGTATVGLASQGSGAP
jgi:hypothetical protein